MVSVVSERWPTVLAFWPDANIIPSRLKLAGLWLLKFGDGLMAFAGMPFVTAARDGVGRSMGNVWPLGTWKAGRLGLAVVLVDVGESMVEDSDILCV